MRDNHIICRNKTALCLAYRIDKIYGLIHRILSTNLYPLHLQPILQCHHLIDKRVEEPKVSPAIVQSIPYSRRIQVNILLLQARRQIAVQDRQDRSLKGESTNKPMKPRPPAVEQR